MLKRQKCYLLQTINDTSWLLPYGQAVAEQKKGCQLNETGVFIWQTLAQPMSEPQLIAALAEHYEIDSHDLPALSDDIHTFVRDMLNMGYLREDLTPQGTPLYRTMQIANLRIGLYGPAEIFPTSFEAFYIETEASKKTDTSSKGHTLSNKESFSDDSDSSNTQSINQKIEAVLTPPSWCPPGNVLIQNRELTLYENEDMYRIVFPEMTNIFEARMTKDGHYVRIYCRQPMNEEESDHIFHAIRFFFLYLAGMHGLFALHSASILYHGKAWLFSGHSGMGKSTHTALWHDLIGTPYLNGDLNLIGIENGQYQVYGIPWCGTSGIFTTKTYPLGGIVLLGRASEDHLEPLDDAEKALRVMQRLISPSWTTDELKANLAFAADLSQQIPVYYLCCTKNPSAVDIIKTAIDKEEALHHA